MCLCFENDKNGLENWAKWISYIVLAVEKNCNVVITDFDLQ